MGCSAGPDSGMAGCNCHLESGNWYSHLLGTVSSWSVRPGRPDRWADARGMEWHAGSPGSQDDLHETVWICEFFRYDVCTRFCKEIDMVGFEVLVDRFRESLDSQGLDRGVAS